MAIVNRFSSSQYKKSNAKPTPLFNRFKAPPVQLTAWTHEAKYSTDHVAINLALLPKGVREGDIAELVLLGSERHRKVLFVVKKPSKQLLEHNPELQVSSPSGAGKSWPRR
jgi:hypothetical protein